MTGTGGLHRQPERAAERPRTTGLALVEHDPGGLAGGLRVSRLHPESHLPRWISATCATAADAGPKSLASPPLFGARRRPRREHDVGGGRQLPGYLAAARVLHRDVVVLSAIVAGSGEMRSNLGGASSSKRSKSNC